jgi:formylmethanofuran dehydrogenase subunit D
MWNRGEKMLKTYKSNIVEILENGDAILQLPPELCEEMGWVEGDTLSFTEEKNKIIIKKINDDDKNKSLDKSS